MDAKLTPVMKQYMEIKKKHQEEVLFFRMGDFYEMFFEDAQIASKILDIALTSRQNDIPMCGIPYHAAESYIARLIKAGKRIALCEQMETTPSSGTVVRREVVRIITPGTIIEANLLQSDYHNYLCSVIIDREAVGLAFVDVSTGDFFVNTVNKTADLFRGEMSRFNPREVIYYEDEGNEDKEFLEYLKNRDIPIQHLSPWLYDQDYMANLISDIYQVASTKGLGISGTLEILSAGAILQYLRDTHKQSLRHIKHPQRIVTGDRMFLDDATIANLELVRNLQDGTKNRTLYSVLNHTMTAMGRRALEALILSPMLDQLSIEKCLDTVQYFHEYHELLNAVQDSLDRIFDMERIVSRIVMRKSNPKQFMALVQSLEAAMKIRTLLMDQPLEGLTELAASMPDLSSLRADIAGALVEDPPLSPEQGRVVREGYNAELDRLYGLKTNTKEWIVQYQEKEKASLGIPTLRIRYNRIVGYYIEVSKGQIKNIPDYYLRKQTLVGSERYTTEELQRFEAEILSSTEKILEIENRELERLSLLVGDARTDLQSLASTIGTIDVRCSFARCAIDNRYVRPGFTADGSIHIREGRHPVVEKYYTREVFIPNDITLDQDSNVIKIITGPNMSGKSTYIRMCAVIQLMAQLGSFVPAREALVSPVDRIFTRIGASDNIARGESTFLVEMNETASILNSATDRSLVVMDEVGRGTSTYDGLAIAWAIVEYIMHYLKSKTLFATHYHELTRLSEKKGIVNYTVQVKEHLHGVEFLYKVIQGAADKSYGIHVAKLAGIPKAIVEKAEEILSRLEKGSRSARKASTAVQGDTREQLEIFNAQNHIVIQTLKKIDTDTITPLEALNELNRIKNLLGS